MMKWFRKYSRHLMGVLVAFLMVSWLVSGSITGDRDRRSTIDWGTVRGRKLSAREIETASLHCEILSNLQVPWNVPWRGMAQQVQIPALTRAHFAILALEAQEAGIDIADADIDRIISGNAQMTAMADNIRQKLNCRLSDIRAALADFLRVIRRAQLVAETVHVSENEIEHAVRDVNEKVQVAYVAFPNDKFVDKSAPVSEEEIKAQFDLLKDKPATGGKGGGYQHPERVRLEYMVANVADIKTSVSVSEDQARDYYKKNKATFNRIAPPLGAASQPTPEAASAPSSSPGAIVIPPTSSAPSTAPVMRQLLFKEVRDEIENTLRSKAAAARVREMMEQIITDMLKSWDQGRGDDGYAKRPAGVDAPDYLDKLAAQYTARFGVKVTFGKTGLVDRKTMIDDPVIGKAGPPETTGPNGQPQQEPNTLTLNNLAFRVQGLYDAKNRSETEVRLALYEPATQVFIGKDARGEPASVFVMRVVEARKPEAPASVDEVRNKVIEDVRLKKAATTADAMAERLYQAARLVGLRAAVDADPGLKEMLAKPATTQPVATPVPNPIVDSGLFARRNIFYFQYGFDIPPSVPGGAKTAEEAFEMVADNWQSPPSTAPAATQVSAPATQPAPKVRLVAVPDQQTRIVMEYRKHEPAREDQLAQMRKQIESAMRMKRIGDAMEHWFKEDAIFARMKFEPANKREVRAPGAPPTEEMPEDSF